MLSVFQLMFSVISALVGVVLGFLLTIFWDKRSREQAFKSYLRSLFYEIDSNIKIIDEKRFIPVKTSQGTTVNVGIEPMLANTAYISFIFSGYFEKLPIEIRSSLEETYGLITIRNGLLASNAMWLNFNFDVAGQKVTIKGTHIISSYTSLIRAKLEEAKNKLLKQYPFIH